MTATVASHVWNLPEGKYLRHVADPGAGHAGPAVAGGAAEHADVAVADPAAPDHHREDGRLAAAARAEQAVAASCTI